ncbi:hypothetical protein [Bacillus mycoides]|uniref:hypothetical protein n=1 Tax=Bacillus mycoides TaxID=1405 RepID=UPI001C027428|nr:hypothetical protein [Bacillus mycoides]QWI52499.1 hypothetical protein EXW56_26925 [Bacillus mycoides]
MSFKKEYNCTLSDEIVRVYKDTEGELNIEIVNHEERTMNYVYLDKQNAVDLANNILVMFGEKEI